MLGRTQDDALHQRAALITSRTAAAGGSRGLACKYAAPIQGAETATVEAVEESDTGAVQCNVFQSVSDIRDNFEICWQQLEKQGLCGISWPTAKTKGEGAFVGPVSVKGQK